MRSFVVVGQTASASDDFLLDDIPGTSGRLDVLARCIRATLLVSHGVRRDTRLYLVLLGGARAPRTVRFEGDRATFLRPDERSLAVLLKKVLAEATDTGPTFDHLRQGISVARGGVEVVLPDLGSAKRYVLDESARDVRESVPSWDTDVAFLLGDHRGLDEASRAAFGDATPIRVGPLSLHTEDAIVLVANELDRAGAR